MNVTNRTSFAMTSAQLKSPRVSVCMPAHNAERFVREAVESALQQTHRNLEIICVDDGSTDGTYEILQSCEPWIQLIRTENRGAPAARNTALSAATGQFVQFLDADNLLLPESIEKKLVPLLRDEADLAFSNQVFLHDSGDIQHVRSRADPSGMDPFDYCLRFNDPGGRTAIDTNAGLHRMEVLQRIGGFREHVVRNQDKDLAIREAAAGARFFYVDEELSIYRDHAGPRVSKSVQSQDALIDYWTDLIVELQRNRVYDFSEARRSAAGHHLIRKAKILYRTQHSEAAIRGFAQAHRLSGSMPTDESSTYRFLRSVVGYPRTEKLRAMASSLVGGITRPFPSWRNLF